MLRQNEWTMLCSSETGYCGMCDWSTAKLLFSVWDYEAIRVKEDG